MLFRSSLSGTLSAALASDETIRIYDGATCLGTASPSSAGPTWFWRFTDPRILSDGQAVSYTALVADLAGNKGAAGSAYDLSVDTSAPATTAAVTAVLDDVGFFQGVVARGGRTDDTQLSLSGTLSAALASDETIRIYDGATCLGTASPSSAGPTWF